MAKMKFMFGAMSFEDARVENAVTQMNDFLYKNAISYVNHTTNYVVHSGNIHLVIIVMVYKEPVE